MNHLFIFFIIIVFVVVGIWANNDEDNERNNFEERLLAQVTNPGQVKCRGSDYDKIPADHCKAQYSTDFATCSARIRKCFCQYNIPLKWVGKGCGKRSGDGGCQCADYCGYTCEEKCVADSACVFQSGTCVNNATGIGGPMGGQCPEACFSGDTKVVTLNRGIISMEDVVVGDFVQDISKEDPTKITFTEVIAMLHKEDSTNPLMEIELSSNATVVHVSPDHLMMVLDEMNNRKFVFASRVEVGSRMIFSDQKSGAINIASVTRITWNVVKRGLYSPATMSGTLLVNGILASGYAGVDHDLAHMAYAPLRMFARFIGKVPEWHDPWTSIHWYPNLLRIFELFVPKWIYMPASA